MLCTKDAKITSISRDYQDVKTHATWSQLFYKLLSIPIGHQKRYKISREIPRPVY